MVLVVCRRLTMRPPGAIGLTGFSLIWTPYSWHLRLKGSPHIDFSSFRPHHSAQPEPSHAAPYYVRTLEGFKLFAPSQSASHLNCLDSVPFFLQYLAPPNASLPPSQAEEIYCDDETANLLLQIQRCANSNSARFRALWKDPINECWICKRLLTAESISKTHILFTSTSDPDVIRFSCWVQYSQSTVVIMVPSTCNFRVIHRCSLLNGCYFGGK
jgi:hypothetical protein